jgi:hypothetical protein
MLQLIKNALTKLRKKSLKSKACDTLNRAMEFLKIQRSRRTSAEIRERTEVRNRISLSY